ncbi:hypothetical protein ACFSRY_17675 [Pontibacter locisalis]|uniref:STAS/SEC14 domain-containing protein n=1 Tax=Pontibacter locisalis TaxID=1719035 RepID=A0ABW5IPY0_9BACT
MIISTDNKISRIELLCDGQILRLTWLQQPDDHKFKEAFSAFLEIAKKYKVKSLISDNSKGININISLQRWITEICAIYLPQLEVKRYARIITQDAFQQLVTYKVHDSLNSMVRNELDLRIFTEVETGMDWLLSESIASASNIA